MLDKLLEAWRGRRAVIIGKEEGLRPALAALLDALGARPALLGCTEGRQTLCRAMQTGRVSAVILAQMPEDGGLCARLEAIERVLTEAREAGIPLTLICSEAEVYAGESGAWYPDEHSAVGGRTKEGLFQTLGQLYAEGFSRGLLGDAVTTLIVRHMPCLGCGGESVRQYDGWCRAMDEGRRLCVEDPEQQGVFLHPLDAACGALALGARYLLKEDLRGGIFNLGAGAQNLSANRSAADRMIGRFGGLPSIEEVEAGRLRPLLFNGSRARRLCGARTRLTGDEALDWRMRALTGKETLETQAEGYLRRLEQKKQGRGGLF